MADNMINIACEILKRINELPKRKNIIEAIDGRCASGKSTAAYEIKKICDCNVIAMDHFFLQPWQRSEKRLKEPGGNVDYERVLKEVIIHIKKGESFCYRPYDCHRQMLSEPLYFENKGINIVEGSYSCHPELEKYYDLKIFMTVNSREQAERIIKRNGEDGYISFRDKWIPFEEMYFNELGIRDRCDMVFDTGEY